MRGKTRNPHIHPQQSESERGLKRKQPSSDETEFESEAKMWKGDLDGLHDSNGDVLVDFHPGTGHRWNLLAFTGDRLCDVIYNHHHGHLVVDARDSLGGSVWYSDAGHSVLCYRTVGVGGKYSACACAPGGFRVQHTQHVYRRQARLRVYSPSEYEAAWCADRGCVGDARVNPDGEDLEFFYISGLLYLGEGRSHCVLLGLASHPFALTKSETVCLDRERELERERERQREPELEQEQYRERERE